jgi:prepilin-type N-terminal cleavage/methylation domain-containing protein
MSISSPYSALQIPHSAFASPSLHPDNQQLITINRAVHSKRAAFQRFREFRLTSLRAVRPYRQEADLPPGPLPARRASRPEGRPLWAGGRPPTSGFTLVELMVVLAIMILVAAFIAPAFTSIKSAGDVTTAAYTIKGALEQARSYAMANNTYTWVGFFEEDVSTASTNPATAGVGRVVMSIVASRDGTMLYTGTLSSPVTLDPPSSTTLLQIGKLAKIDNAHLKTFAAGLGTGNTFDTRPAVGSSTAKIGNDPSTPPNPSLTFHYPAGSSSPPYTFVKVVQFSPRGEGVIDNSNYTLTPVSEIGLQPTHGTAVDTNTPNVVAIQFTGVGGSLKIYRR